MSKYVNLHWDDVTHDEEQLAILYTNLRLIHSDEASLYTFLKPLHLPAHLMHSSAIRILLPAHRLALSYSMQADLLQCPVQQSLE